MSLNLSPKSPTLPMRRQHSAGRFQKENCSPNSGLSDENRIGPSFSRTPKPVKCPPKYENRKVLSELQNFSPIFTPTSPPSKRDLRFLTRSPIIKSIKKTHRILVTRRGQTDKENVEFEEEATAAVEFEQEGSAAQLNFTDISTTTNLETEGTLLEDESEPEFDTILVLDTIQESVEDDTIQGVEETFQSEFDKTFNLEEEFDQDILNRCFIFSPRSVTKRAGRPIGKQDAVASSSRVQL